MKIIETALLIFFGLMLLGIVAHILEYVFLVLKAIFELIKSILIVLWDSYTLFIFPTFIGWLIVKKNNPFTYVWKNCYQDISFWCMIGIMVLGTLGLIYYRNYSDFYNKYTIQRMEWKLNKDGKSLYDILPEEVYWNYLENGIRFTPSEKLEEIKRKEKK